MGIVEFNAGGQPFNGQASHRGGGGGEGVQLLQVISPKINWDKPLQPEALFEALFTSSVVKMQLKESPLCLLLKVRRRCSPRKAPRPYNEKYLV